VTRLLLISALAGVAFGFATAYAEAWSERPLAMRGWPPQFEQQDTIFTLPAMPGFIVGTVTDSQFYEGIGDLWEHRYRLELYNALFWAVAASGTTSVVQFVRLRIAAKSRTENKPNEA
jgi:hypothetical protein